MSNKRGPGVWFTEIAAAASEVPQARGPLSKNIFKFVSFDLHHRPLLGNLLGVALVSPEQTLQLGTTKSSTTKWPETSCRSRGHFSLIDQRPRQGIAKCGRPTRGGGSIVPKALHPSLLRARGGGLRGETSPRAL